MSNHPLEQATQTPSNYIMSISPLIRNSSNYASNCPLTWNSSNYVSNCPLTWNPSNCFEWSLTRTLSNYINCQTIVKSPPYMKSNKTIAVTPWPLNMQTQLRTCHVWSNLKSNHPHKLSPQPLYSNISKNKTKTADHESWLRHVIKQVIKTHQLSIFSVSV